MSQIDISNIINVSITNTPQGVGVRNVNNLLLLTNEKPNNYDVYRSYVSASAVAEDYGTDSLTTKMATAIFAQTPNILTGKGRLNITPMKSAVSATSGKSTTVNLTSELSAITAVGDGDLRVTINSVINDLANLDFTGATTLEDVAAVMGSRLIDAEVKALNNTLIFTSKKVGSSSAVTISALSGGSGTDLAGASYFDSANATETVGSNSSGESVLEAITRIDGGVPFTGVMTSLDLEDAAISTIAAFIQARDNLFLHHAASTQDIAGIVKTIKDASQKKTRLLLYTKSIADANIMKAAYAGRAFSVNMDGSQLAQTMHLKSLSNITPDTGISQTLYDLAKTNGCDIYVDYGVPAICSTGGNDYFDNQYSNLAIKFALTTAGFNFLRQTNTKVPQTEEGMNGLKSAYSVVCEQFVKNGFIAGGSWTSSETFGDPEIFKENILRKGFYVYSLPITQQNSTEREARKAPLVQIALKRSGAIHESDVIAIINP
ncbi:MAG: DUF3383 family protein [Rickettsiales bacterium]